MRVNEADTVPTTDHVLPHRFSTWSALFAVMLLLATPIGCATSSAPVATPPRVAEACHAGPVHSAFELAVLGSGGPTSFGRAASGYIVFVGGVARMLSEGGM